MSKALFCFAAALGQSFRPGKKILYKAQAGILHVLGNLCQQVNQVLINLQVVGLGGFHQTVDRGTGLCTVDGVKDVPVGSTNSKGPDGSLYRRIINGNFSIFQEYPQIFFLVHTVLQTIFCFLTDDTGKVLGRNTFSFHIEIILAM